jgi:hypothetical protein
MFGAKQSFSVVFRCRQRWYGDSLDERVSEVVDVVSEIECCQVRPSFNQWASCAWCQLPPNPFVNGETAMQRVTHGPPQGQNVNRNKAIICWIVHCTFISIKCMHI